MIHIYLTFSRHARSADTPSTAEDNVCSQIGAWLRFGPMLRIFARHFLGVLFEALVWQFFGQCTFWNMLHVPFIQFPRMNHFAHCSFVDLDSLASQQRL